MKRYIKTFSIISILSLLFTSNSFSQSTIESVYISPDYNNSVTPKIYIKSNKDQHQVWFYIDSDWKECEITSIKNNYINLTFENHQYSIELDPANKNKIQVYNKDFTKNWRYIKN